MPFEEVIDEYIDYKGNFLLTQIPYEIGTKQLGSKIPMVLAKNGKLYAFPLNNSFGNIIYEIDIYTKEAKQVNNIFTIKTNYTNGLLAENGNIYFMPKEGNNVLEFNPYTYEYKTYFFENLYFQTCIYGSNNKIYCFPYAYTTKQIYIFNTETKSLTPLMTTSSYYNDAICSHDKKIYALDSSSIVSFDSQTDVIKYLNSNGLSSLDLKKIFFINKDILLLIGNRDVIEYNVNTETFVIYKQSHIDFNLYSCEITFGADGNLYFFKEKIIYKYDKENKKVIPKFSFERYFTNFYSKTFILMPDGKHYQLHWNDWTLISIDLKLGQVSLEQCLSPFLNKCVR
ncbi:MAG: hypothetical protein ACRCX2_39445 [Paraclostridium sp.]